MFLFRQDATDFGGSIFHCINSRLATAIQLAWSASKNTTRFGIGGKYDIDSDASLSVSRSVCRSYCLYSLAGYENFLLRRLVLKQQYTSTAFKSLLSFDSICDLQKQNNF